jgi:hypothetical protein
MKNLYFFGIMLFLSMNQTWAGTMFTCSVPLQPAIVSDVSVVTSNNLALISENKYTIRIFNQGASVYTNFSLDASSYVEGGIVREVFGRIKPNQLHYAAYLSNIYPQNNMAIWNFVFFDPRTTSDITQRYFVMGVQCDMSGYSDSAAERNTAEILPSRIAQNNRTTKVIKPNFTNLSQLYNEPATIREREDDFTTCEKCCKITDKILYTAMGTLKAATAIAIIGVTSYMCMR